MVAAFAQVPELEFYESTPEMAYAMATQLHQDGVRKSLNDEETWFGDLCRRRGEEVACQVDRWKSTGVPSFFNLSSPMEVLCRRGDPVGCLNLAYLKIQRNFGVNDPGKHSYQDGLVDLHQMCSQGLGRACTELAKVYVDGIGRRKDLEKALEYAVKGCDAKSPVGCRLASQMQSEEEAKQTLLRRAAELGDLEVRFQLDTDPDLLAHCESGVMLACEQGAKALDVPVENRLRMAEIHCHEDRDSCQAMVDLRLELDDAGDLAIVREREPKDAWLVGRRILLEYKNGAWPDHIVVGKEDLTNMVMRVIRAQGDSQEYIELKLGHRWVKAPFALCPEKAEAMMLAGWFGFDPWALSPMGAPELSSCLDSHPQVPYFGGRVVVDPTNTKEDIADESRIIKRSVERSTVGLISCRKSAPFDLDPIWLTARVLRDGTVKRVKVTKSSKLEELDACVVDWLEQLQLKKIDNTTPVEVKVRLF